MRALINIIHTNMKMWVVNMYSENIFINLVDINNKNDYLLLSCPTL